jgi:hypothetical protein
MHRGLFIYFMSIAVSRWTYTMSLRQMMAKVLKKLIQKRKVSQRLVDSIRYRHSNNTGMYIQVKEYVLYTTAKTG